MAFAVEVRKRRNGPDTYRVRWRQIGLVPVVQQASFPTQDQAQKFKLLVEAHGNEWPPGLRPTTAVQAPGEHTFTTWAETAISRRHITERVRADYRRDVATYMKPMFGHLAPAAITADVASEWLDWLPDQGVASKTIANLNGLASSIMADALAQHPPVAHFNPFLRRRGEGLPKHPLDEQVFLTPAEYRLILDAMDPFYRPLTMFLAGTGLRYGEATALRVSDLHLTVASPYFVVTEAWKRQPDSSYERGDPKTRKGRRRVSLPQTLVTMLQRHIEGRAADELLFPSVRGHQLLNGTFHDSAWRPAVARARICDEHLGERVIKRGKPVDVKPCGCKGTLTKQPDVKSLRHSHVSWLIDQGVPLAVISKRIGHSSITTTVDTYGHLLPDSDATINDAVDSVLS